MITAQLCGQVVSMVAHHGGSRNLASVRRQTHHVHRMLPGVDIPGSLRHLHPLHTTHRRADPPLLLLPSSHALGRPLCYYVRLCHTSHLFFRYRQHNEDTCRHLLSQRPYPLVADIVGMWYCCMVLYGDVGSSGTFEFQSAQDTGLLTSTDRDHGLQPRRVQELGLGHGKPCCVADHRLHVRAHYPFVC